MRNRGISSDLIAVVGLSVWILGLPMAFCLNAANACSVELHSITRIFESSHRVIVGVVESVEVDSPELVDDDSYLLTIEAGLRVEHTLKGDPDPEFVQLSFPLENSCSGFYDGYGIGGRFILMLSEPDDAGVYRAPSIPPFRLRLPTNDGYAETLLYRYIQGLGIEGQPPVSIDFSGQKQQTIGHRLDAEITIKNALPSTLTVRVSNLAPPRAEDGSRPALDGLSLWLEANGALSTTTTPDLYRVNGGDTLVVDLGEFYDVAAPGSRWIRGFLWLPGGETMEPFQHPDYEEPLQGPFQGLWEYQVLEETLIRDRTWGGLKSR